jgi:diguanylate cyclase (GGDEF)-like protein
MFIKWVYNTYYSFGGVFVRKKIVIFLISLLLLAVGIHSIFMRTIYEVPVEKVAYMEDNGIDEKETVEFGLFAVLGTNKLTSINLNNFIYRYRFWMIGIGLLMILGTLWILALNYLVQTRTKALFEVNEQLSHSQSQNKAIINAIPDGIFLLDNDSRVLECKIDGSITPFPKRSDMMMRKLSDIMPVPYGEKLNEAIENMTRINELHTLELEITLEGVRTFFEVRLIRSGKKEVIALVRDMTSHYENLENIKYLSYHDQLTGLFNRHMFEEELERLDVNRNTPLSVIMADVNGLKLVNDCFGHPTGDKLLIQFSEILKKVFRADDIICRLGGDEFVIILPHTTHDVTRELIKRINAACDEIKFYNLSLSVAFGSATKIAMNDSIIDVMKYAEDQMYKTKLFEAPKIKEQMVAKLLDSLFESSDAEAIHAEAVETYSEMLGDAIGLNPTELETLRMAARHHDIGKIAIDKKVLYKKSNLSTSEMEIIRSHPDIGYRILSVVNEMSECADIVLAHHERWDGKGYPKGLSGDDIPLMSRIISIADVYSTITLTTFYKDAMTPLEGVEEIDKHSGTQFDPILGRKFVALMKDKM